MRNDYIDFHAVADLHLDIHARLENWARWVRTSPQSGWTASPMWRQVKSLARQWHVPEYRENCDLLDAHEMERQVRLLPNGHRDAIRWCYVYGGQPGKAAKLIGVSKDMLKKLVEDGRQMLKNRNA